MINYTLLDSQIELFSKQFSEAKPFPHLVIDNFLDASVAARAHELFPKMEEMDMQNDYRQRKWVARVTGIKNLKADPQLYASGLAQGADGSFMNIHLDKSSHPVNRR